MPAAHELLAGLMESFRERLPGVEFTEALAVGRRLPHRAWVTGTVAKESTQGDQWSARLAFQLYLPGSGPGAGEMERILACMADCAREQPLLAGTERGGAAVDKATGLTAVGCAFTFSRPGSSGGTGGSGSSGGKSYPVEIGGRDCTVTGWKVSESASGGGLTAIGESVPFYYKGGREFSIELQGLSLEAPERLSGFTIRLGGQDVTYAGCRWKSISAAGTCTALAAERTEGGQDGEP